MAIEAQLADGRILEFPDGTDPSIIQATVKKMVQAGQPAPTAAKAPATEGVPFADSLGGEFAGFAPALTPPSRSATEQFIEQRQAPGLPADPLLEPRFVQAVEAQLNALPAEQRGAALDRLLQREDVYGRAARVVQNKYAQLNKIDTETGREMADPRLEAQTARFIRQGAPRDLAEHLARRDALSGRIGRGVQRLERDVVGERAGAEAEARAKELADAGFFERVGAQAASEYTKAGLGLINVFADITGDKNMQGIARDARRVEEARQGVIPKGASIFERSAQGAIASLATQAPVAVLSIVTGTAAPVLLQAGLQQFGDSYGESRAAGKSAADAATRAIPMAAAEVFFERFGMEKAMAGLKAFVDKNGYAEVPKYVAKAIATELPSEMATTVTQYGIDMLPEAGLNKNPSLLGLYQQLEETLRQTVIQAGTQSGLIIAGAKGTEKLSKVLSAGRQPAPDENYAELLARTKGFLVPEGGQTPPAAPTAETPPAPATAEAPPATPPAAAEAPPVAPAAPVAPDARIEELTARGIEAGLPDEDARARAEAVVAREQAQQEATLAPRVEALTQEFIDAGVEPTQARTRALEQAKQEAQDDVVAESESAVAGGAAAPIPGAGGTGMAVAGGPQPGTPTEGVAGAEPAGVAPAGRATEVPAGGEAGAPAALKEPPVQPGFVRVYHSGERGEGKSRWVSTDRTYAANYRPDLPLFYTDIPADDPRVNNPDYPEQGAAQGFTFNFELPPEEAGVLKEISRVEAAPTKRRGRPAVLTPEEKAAKAADKKPLQAAKMKAERAVGRITKSLDALAQPLDLSTIESDEALTEAENERRAQKREVIKELLTLQADPNLRGTAVGNRVKAALEHPSITAKEKADIKAGIEAQKRAAPESEATSTNIRSGRGKPDTKFGKFKTASQAISHIAKTGNRVQRAFAQRLRNFVTGVEFVVIEQGQELPPLLQNHANQWDRSIGLFIENYDTGQRAIYVRGASFGEQQGINNVTVLHELLHAATNRKIALAEDQVRAGKGKNTLLVEAYDLLLLAMRRAQREFADLATLGSLDKAVADLYASTDGAVVADPREFVAYGLTDESFQTFLAGTPGVVDEPSLLSNFVSSIRKFFGFPRTEYNALTDLILATDAILTARAPSARPSSMESVSSAVEPATRTEKEIVRAFQVANEKFEQSRNGEEYAKGVSAIQMLQSPRLVGRALANMWGTFNIGARKAMTRVLPTDFMSDAFGEAVPELKNTDRLMQKMGGMTLKLLESAGKLTKEVDRAYRKDPALRDKLDRITHTSTLAEIDPSNPNAKERSAGLDALWSDLGADGQRLYRRIKDHFEVLSDYFGQLLDEQITSSGLPIAERANLLQKVRAMYETGAKISPFFPLVRRGDFWLSIGSGKTRKFFMFETLAERDDAMRGFADERVKRKPNESAAAFEKRRAENLQELLETQEYVYGNDISTLRRLSGDSSEMLKEVFAAIDSANLGDENAKDGLKDAVYQIYLQTMPEQSFRRQFIHRQGVMGFRTDVLRNTADATARMASQLARLKYGRLLRNSLSQARDSIVNRPEYEPIVAAFERRVGEELNPTPQSNLEKAAAIANKASFVWYLGAASSALLQPLSIFQTGYPVLAAQHGFAKASAELTKMLKVWNQYGVYEKNADGSTSFKMPTVEHAAGLTPEERRAVRAMKDFNLTTSTYASDMFDYKNTPSGSYSNPVVQFGKDTVDAVILGGLMHTTERISREVVFLTSFRLNRKAGKSFDEAIDQAVVDTKEALGNYGEYNRPEFMRGAPGKLLTQFMMYPVHVSLFLLRNFAEMIKPMDKRTRQEARRKFFGTLGTSFILAGAVGLPMFSTVMGLLGWAWEKFKDDEDPEDLRKLSFELWFRTKWLQEQLGETKIAGKSLADVAERGVANAITGLDISGRTSLNNLWTRDTKEYATVRENATAMAMEKAGPAANMLLSWAEAYEAFANGDYAKGFKKASPAGVRNFINTYEQFKEGAKDNKGAKILSRDAFTTGELIGQAVGFRSDLLANLQYTTFKVIGLEQKINNERNLILNQLEREFRQRDMKAFAKYMKDRNEFNQKYPTYAITDETIADSLEAKTEKRVSSYRGVNLTEKNIGLATALIPSRKAAAEKEKKGRGE